jgi:UPF0148 protein
MEEDEVLSKITKLLEQGCTMLATHHDCGAPLFRRHGEVVCPVCSFVDESNSPARTQPSGLPETELEGKSHFDRAQLQEREKIGDQLSGDGAKSSHIGKQDDDELIAAIGNLRASLLQRLQEFTVTLKNERDLDKLKKQLDCLEGLLRVFRSLQR